MSVSRKTGTNCDGLGKNYDKDKQTDVMKEEWRKRGGVYVRLWAVGEGGPRLTSAAAEEIIPAIIQDVLRQRSKGSAASLYDLRKTFSAVLLW